MFDVSESEEDDILAKLRHLLFKSVPTVAGNFCAVKPAGLQQIGVDLQQHLSFNTSI
tara:strand:- start:37 stop:207 length:171 start_codon:yes stop_codon:yes gene_type:complete